MSSDLVAYGGVGREFGCRMSLRSADAGLIGSRAFRRGENQKAGLDKRNFDETKKAYSAGSRAGRLMAAKAAT
jgi:hypothetical protein